VDIILGQLNKKYDGDTKRILKDLKNCITAAQ
jgi:hypothetical protein